MIVKHVIVVGAGAAGLMAANKLASSGFQVTILEARNRIGGRIETITGKFSSPVDTGAEFIHGEQPITMQLAKSQGLKLEKMQGRMYSIERGELVQRSMFDSDWDKVVNKLHKLKADTNMATFMHANFPYEKFRELNEDITGFVEGYDAADMNRVSAFALRDEWSETDEAHQYHIHTGYGSMMNQLAEEFQSKGGEIRQSSIVKSVKFDQGPIKVLTENGIQLECDRLLVTVPLGVLQRQQIQFEPPLVGHQKAFEMIGFGTVIKFLVEFKTTFLTTALEKRNLHKMSFVFSDAVVPTWWRNSSEENGVMVGWLGGPSAAKASGDQQLSELALQSLQYILRCEHEALKENITSMHVADWLTDPFARGAYSYPTVQTKTALEVINQPILGRIYFAGEAFYSGTAMGTVEAAFASGNDVADRIIAQSKL